MASTEILLLITVVVAAIYFWCKHNFSYWQRHGIPYKKPTPFIGNTKEAFTLKTSFGMHLSDIYNDPEFSNAPLVGIYSLNKPGLVIREPELLKSMLIKDFSKFSNRYSACDPHGDPLGSNNLFFVKNPLWKEIRAKLSPVFTSGKIKQMYPLTLEIGAELEKHLESHPKTSNAFVADIKEICALFTTDLIATIAFGIRANSLQNPDGEFRKNEREILEFSIPRALEFFIALYVPKLVSLFRVKLFTKDFSKFLRGTINHAMKERESSGGVRNDLIDVLVQLKKEAALEPQAKHLGSSTDFLVSQAAVFLTAGFETSSSTMTFALYELSKYPEMQKRLRAEIHEALVAGNGTLTYDKLNSLEYLGMVLDETLRMYPVLPILEREYQENKSSKFTLKPYYDYTLVDGTPIFIPVYGIQRNPKYWPNPNTFDPERFSSENKKLHTPMTYMPFGDGPRNCIGSRIGLLQARIGLVHILKNHYVARCDKTVKEMKFEPKTILLSCEGNIYLNIVKDSLYNEKSAQRH